ncbi:hypothetical protein HMI56_003475 [Coelomomyces lativittatus]|nr:hypothetical protein HMI56_003475 [Coelomomyces lativittatus]
MDTQFTKLFHFTLPIFLFLTYIFIYLFIYLFILYLDIIVVSSQSSQDTLKAYFRNYEGRRPELIFVEDTMNDGEVLRKIKDKIKYDVLLVSVDSFPDTPLTPFLNRYRIEQPKAIVMAYPNDHADTLLVYAKDQLLHKVNEWKQSGLYIPTDLIRAFPNVRIAPFQDARIFLFSKKTWEIYLTELPLDASISNHVFSPLLRSQYPRPPPPPPTLTGWPCPNPSVMVFFSSQSMRVTHFASYLSLNQKYAQGVHASAELALRTQICSESMINKGTKCGDRCSIKKSVVGAHVLLGKNVKLVNTVIMDHVVLEDDVKLESCIVGHSAKIMEKCFLKDVIVCSKASVQKDTTLRNEWVV